MAHTHNHHRSILFANFNLGLDRKIGESSLFGPVSAWVWKGLNGAEWGLKGVEMGFEGWFDDLI